MHSCSANKEKRRGLHAGKEIKKQIFATLAHASKAFKRDRGWSDRFYVCIFSFPFLSCVYGNSNSEISIRFDELKDQKMDIKTERRVLNTGSNYPYDFFSL